MLNIPPENRAQAVGAARAAQREISARLGVPPDPALLRSRWVISLGQAGCYLGVNTDDGSPAVVGVQHATVFSAADAEVRVAGLARAEMVGERAALIREYAAVGELAARVAAPDDAALLAPAPGVA